MMQTQGSEWTQDPLCYQGPGDVKKAGEERGGSPVLHPRVLSSPLRGMSTV